MRYFGIGAVANQKHTTQKSISSFFSVFGVQVGARRACVCVWERVFIRLCVCVYVLDVYANGVRRKRNNQLEN